MTAQTDCFVRNSGHRVKPLRSPLFLELFQIKGLRQNTFQAERIRDKGAVVLQIRMHFLSYSHAVLWHKLVLFYGVVTLNCLVA